MKKYRVEKNIGGEGWVVLDDTGWVVLWFATWRKAITRAISLYRDFA